MPILALLAALASPAFAQGAFDQLQSLADSPGSARLAFDGQEAGAPVALPTADGSTDTARTPPPEEEEEEGAPPTPIAKPKPKDEIPPRLKEEVSAKGREVGGKWGSAAGLVVGAGLGLLAALAIGGPLGVLAFIAIAAVGYFAGKWAGGKLGEVVAQKKAREALDEMDKSS